MEKKHEGKSFQAVTPELRRTKRNLAHWQRGGERYFLTFNTKGIMLTPGERKIVFDACFFWQDKKWEIHQLVVMPTHVHMLVTPLQIETIKTSAAELNSAPLVDPEPRWYSLGEMVHSVKRFSAREINKLRGREGTVWWSESYDRLIRNEEEFQQKHEYVRGNVVKEGLAEKPEEYEFYWDEAC